MNGDVTDERLLDKFQGAMAFSAIGDALGWPTELGRYPGIVRKQFGKAYLTDFIEWEKTVGGRFWGYREKIREGQYSDDTQLSLAIARCSDDEGNFDPDKFAYLELPLWLSYERGGGRTIKAAARNMIQSRRDWISNFYARKDLSYRSAGANGAAMRVLPIALVNANNKDRLYRDSFLNSIVTHGHPRAIMGSIVYASAITFLISESHLSKETFYEYLRDTINNWSQVFKGDERIHRWVHTWDSKPLHGMRFKELFQKTRGETLEFLQGQKQYTGRNDRDYYAFIGALDESTKGSGTSTVLAAIYLFIKYIDDPTKAIFSAVNMLGTDTDTIGSFVGGLLGAYYGLSAVPETLLRKLQDKEYILATAARLHDVITGKELRRHLQLRDHDRKDAFLKILAWEIGLHEMFWDALAEGESLLHPALGRGTIRHKRVEPIRREGYEVKLIEVDFECGQSCTFHSRVAKEGNVSESLSRDVGKALQFLEAEETKNKMVVPSPSLALDEVKRAYEIIKGQWEGIEGFLKKHLFLLPVLKEAEQKVWSIFGGSTGLSLELHRDPKEDFEELFVIIKTSRNPDEARALMSRLDQEWFLKVMDKTQGKLNITEEYG